MPFTLRSGRGYYFETKIVADFNDNDPDPEKDQGWYSKRLGGSSSGLPDVIVTNNKQSILWSMECKSRTAKTEEEKNGKLAVIPPIQIQRCYDMFNMFSIYKTKNVVFAFKFNIKKPRSAVFHFFKILRMENVKSVMCSRDGKLTFTAMDKSKLPIIFYFYYDSIEGLKHNEHVSSHVPTKGIPLEATS